MFELGLISCFVAVADALSFTRGAATLGLTQPQATLRVRKLETQLGFPLFVRTTRQVELTAEAERFLPHAREIVAACKSAEDFLSGLHASRLQRVRLGSPEVTVAATPTRSKLLNRFIDRYPEIQLELSVDVSHRLLDKLRAFDLDGFLTFRFLADRRAAPTPGWMDVIAMARSVAFLITPREHPLARRQAIAPADMAGHVMAVSPGTDCPDTIEDIQAYLRSLSMRYRLAPEAYRATLEHFARTHRLPSFAWVAEGESPPETKGDMVVLPFSDAQFMIDLCLVTRSDDQSLATRRLRAIAQEVAADSRWEKSPGRPLEAVADVLIS